MSTQPTFVIKNIYAQNVPFRILPLKRLISHWWAVCYTHSLLHKCHCVSGTSNLLWSLNTNIQWRNFCPHPTCRKSPHSFHVFPACLLSPGQSPFQPNFFLDLGLRAFLLFPFWTLTSSSCPQGSLKTWVLCETELYWNIE